jgi:hypothetical protein
MPKLGTVAENERRTAAVPDHWPSYQGAGSIPAFHLRAAISQFAADRLCVRYRGKAFLLDDKTPVLTIGRDLAASWSLMTARHRANTPGSNAERWLLSGRYQHQRHFRRPPGARK